MKNTIRSMVLFVCIAFFTGCNTRETDPGKEIQLNEGWKFRQSGQTGWLEATVPGTVHTDLLANGVIEDPFYRLNERDIQWIDKADWEYRKTFHAGSELLAKSRISLCFRGLDTYASVSLNGNRILETDNMFREWEVDVKPFIREGENVLEIMFHSPIAIGTRKYDANGFEIPVSENDLAEIGQVDGGKKVSIYSRKAGYHFGWDWGPRLVTSGIWRPVVLKAWDEAIIRNIQYIQNEVTEASAGLTAVFEIEGQSVSQAEIIIGNEGTVLARKTIHLTAGTGHYSVGFSISKPELWWTNGLGKPYLYSLMGQLEAGGRRQQVETRIGIRKLELVREKDGKGTSFYFRLNGVPVFMKGANYIPNDAFLPRVTEEKYRNIIHTARISNMNMLRIWGGGIYEEDLFYDLCDEAGILVWQDFMFACAMFPGDSAFHENVKAEASDNVIRLRNHPCIALWCGNNEILSAWTNWGWKNAEEAKNKQDADKIWKAYVDIFHHILPGVVQKYDPARSYWDSSPSSGPGIPSDLVNGDEHYWGVWWGKEPFATYATHIARFMSEYGFQSFPEYSTVQKYTLPEDYDIYSEVMKSHQRSSIGNETIEYYMLKEFKKPKDFESFLYVSQVLQAEGIKFALEGHRRAAPFCMGSLYWQLNDVWPVASWSSTDYFQNWKALQYYVKKGFGPVLVSPYLSENEIRVNMINDQLYDLKGILRLKVADFYGHTAFGYEKEATVPANSNLTVFSQQQLKLLENGDPAQLMLVAEFVVNNTVISSNVLYFKPFKELILSRPEIAHTIRKTENGYIIRLSSNSLAKNVWLYLENEKGFFSDNYFDLLPGRQVEIELLTPIKEERMEKVFRLRTLSDAF